MKNNVQGFGHLVHHITQVLHQFLAIKEPLQVILVFANENMNTFTMELAATSTKFFVTRT
jgi:hypothetical protein